jgi:hypothetical protein
MEVAMMATAKSAVAFHTESRLDTTAPTRAGTLIMTCKGFGSHWLLTCFLLPASHRVAKASPAPSVRLSIESVSTIQASSQFRLAGC